MSMQASGGPRYLAGWYPDPYGGSQLRWYDGNVWTEHTYSSAAPALAPHALAQVESTTTVTVVKRSPDHLFHFVMTICTGGLWLPVWIWVSIWPRRTKVTTRTVRG